MSIAKSLTDLIGNTPLLELSNYNKENNLEATIIAKLEYFNPLSSVKDRIGYAMIADAETKGPDREITNAVSGCDPYKRHCLMRSISMNLSEDINCTEI
jgi:cysteine synthase